MKALIAPMALAICSLPLLAAAQDARNPVSDALRARQQRHAKNFVEAAQDMPAEKYGFKPTPAQMSFADVIVHLAEGNDYLCGTIAGQPAPQRTKVVATAAKEALVARLKETFDFCSSALANVRDATLADSVPWFGNRKGTRGNAVIVTAEDWADHYSQVAIYLRLNGLLPPTAKAKS